jgi:hypothetical protein
MIRIAQNRIEVNHAVKRAAGPDPFVYRLPSSFLRFRVVARNANTFKRADRDANQLDRVSVSAGNQLAIGVDQVPRCANVRWIGKVVHAQLCAGETDVIDTFEQGATSSPNNPSDAYTLSPTFLLLYWLVRISHTL